MDLKEILNISGKPGLYKIIAQSTGRIIVESLEDGKRLPVFASNNFSILKDISLFTMEEDLPLEQALKAIYEYEKGKESISHKADNKEIEQRLEAIVPNYDKEQVKHADMKKLFKWYNLLIQKEAWSPVDIAGEEKEEKTEKKEKKEAAPKGEKKAAAPKKKVKAAPKAKKAD
jgi:chemotaxis protein histidine kinase CheA